jgi:hypothetical protein
VKHEITLTTRRPGWAERAWCRRLDMDVPLAVTRNPVGDLVRLLPYRWRRVHRAYATRHGFFWLPCVLCDRPFAGHEYGDIVPDPTRGPGCGVSICSRCTKRRRTAGSESP